MKKVPMGGIPLIIQPEADDPELLQVFIEGLIEGQPYRFLLDTGAARSAVVGDSLLINYTSRGSVESSGSFGRSTQEEWISVPGLSIGPIQRKPFSLVRLPSRDGAKNLLGMDFLRHYALHFCFSDALLIVNPQVELRQDSPFIDLYLDKGAHPYVDVALNSSQLSAVWDSGAGMTVVDLAVISKHPELFTQVGESKGMDSTGASQMTPVLEMAKVTIGGCVFESHKVVGVDLSAVNATLDRPMDMILGCNLLQRADWLFDFPNHRWKITAYHGR